MAKYIKKEEVDVFTFNELAQFAKENSNPPHWSFTFMELPITHENDECYLVPSSDKNGYHVTLHFTKNDLLVIDSENKPYIISDSKELTVNYEKL